MKKQEKLQWILNYIKEHKSVNVLDSDFQNDYIYDCKPNKTGWHMLDFPTTPELGRYLSEMYKSGLLSRVKISIGYREAHTPSFIYNYSLKEGE